MNFMFVMFSLSNGANYFMYHENGKMFLSSPQSNLLDPTPFTGEFDPFSELRIGDGFNGWLTINGEKKEWDAEPYRVSNISVSFYSTPETLAILKSQHGLR